MRTLACIHCPRLWALGLALVVGVSGAAYGTARAQVLEADHLKCYRVLNDNNPVGNNTVLMRTRQFDSTQECTVQNKASFLCAETIKRRVNNGEPLGNDPRGGRAEDFLCYRMTCPDDSIRNIRVNDQFNDPPERVIRIQNSSLFCTPTNKRLLPTVAESEVEEELGEVEQ